MPASAYTEIEVPARRVDGTRWRIPVHSFQGSRPGPRTVIVAGIIGDKPLAVLALHRLRHRLEHLEDLAGEVIVVPVANPFGFQGMTRHDPDLVELNRRFPGRSTGLITDQIAQVLAESLLRGTDVVVDLHSGTSSRALWYTYDYGDVELSASFGYLPVVVDRHVPGQLCTVASSQGVRAFLAEFGGASRDDVAIGVDGCWNTLVHLGQVPHVSPRTPLPDRVPVIDQVKVFLASHEGVLVSEHGPHEVGTRMPAGTVASLVDLMSGEVIEDYVVEAPGTRTGTGAGFDLWGPAVERSFDVVDHPWLMLANACPTGLHAGDFALAVGWSHREVLLPPSGGSQ